MSRDHLIANLTAFKRKYYTNQLIRGALITLILFGSIFLIISVLEGYFWFSQPIRFVLFTLLICLLLYGIIFQIIRPVLSLIHLSKGLSNEDAALEVGRHFPEISDKLLNYLQLAKNDPTASSLLSAALEQKTHELTVFSFKEAVDFKVNKKYVVFLGSVFVFIFLVSFINPNLFTESTSRIVGFNKEFEKPAPFQFIILDDLVAFANDEYQLKVRLEGESIPDQIQLKEQNRLLNMHRMEENTFIFKFPSVTKNRRFSLISAGFRSKEYELQVFKRPEIRVFEIALDYPSYTGISDNTILSTGSLIVPEGTKITWKIDASDSEKIVYVLDQDSVTLTRKDDTHFEYSKTAHESFQYEVLLFNEHAQNKSKISYETSVTKDEAPEISVDFIPDTVSYNSFIFSGSIADDYGFKNLQLKYRLEGTKNYRFLGIPFESRKTTQSFFIQMDLDSITLSENQSMDLFVQVTDNDAVNGYKSTASEKFSLRMPNTAEIESLVDDKLKESQNQLEKSVNKAETLNKKLDELDERLKNKKELGWQDEKLIEDILKDREKLQKEISELKEKHDQLIKSQKEFGKQSEKLQKKAKQLQELISEVLDEETKKLYDELKKLLEEKRNSDQVMEQMSQIRNKEQNVEKELERALELFKRLKLETELEQTAEQLEKLAEKQEDLASSQEQEKNNPGKDSLQKESENSQEQNSSLEEQQEKVQEEFEDIQEKMNDIEKLNQDLKNPEPLEDFSKDEKSIDDKLEEIEQDMQKGDMQKAGQEMQNAGEQMKKMAQKMQQMQGGMEMSMMQENIDHLRDIMDNLLKLSFAQEKIIDEISQVQQVDPRFIELSQEQLKLIDNAEVIEDSLLSLASRVAQISNFVTREVGEININLDKTIYELRERNKGKATSYQQFAMTSMNNLALLLDDVLAQMQMSMAEAMGNPQKGKGQKQSLPDMSQMQQQLGEKIKELKGSGKSGREMSEELAKLAAEQAEIRKQMEQMQSELLGQKELNGDEGKNGQAAGKLGEAIKKMEENEVDLVNKRLTQQLINRQQDIMTRMLESQESLREQKQSPEREGETASEKQRKLPPAIEEYLNAKKKEIELLKTIPLDLNPFYKKEVNDYFRRLSVPDN